MERVAGVCEHAETDVFSSVALPNQSLVLRPECWLLLEGSTRAGRMA